MEGRTRWQENTDNYLLALRILQKDNKHKAKEKKLIEEGIDLMHHIGYWKNNPNKTLFPDISKMLFKGKLDEFVQEQEKGQ